MSDFDWDAVDDTDVPDKWKPVQVGMEIKGILTGLRVEQTKFSDDEVPVLTILTDEGTREVWAQQRHLKSELRRWRPKVGDHISIAFVGEKDTGKASPLKMFEVYVGRDD